MTPWWDCCSDGPRPSQSDCLAFWAWYLFYKAVILHRGGAGWCCTNHLLLQERLPTLTGQVNHDSWALRCQERKNPFWDATQALLWRTRTTLLLIPRNQRLIWYLENAFRIHTWFKYLIFPLWICRKIRWPALFANIWLPEPWFMAYPHIPTGMVWLSQRD